METDLNEKEKNSRNYCSNADMTRELVKFQETGVISEELGQMFIDIATKRANSGKFFNYTEKEDWVGDVILRMVEQIEKFDPKHPKANAFAYFTQIANRKIISNIKNFKKRHNIKTALTERLIDELEQNTKMQHNKQMKENIHYY